MSVFAALLAGLFTLAVVAGVDRLVERLQNRKRVKDVQLDTPGGPGLLDGARGRLVAGRLVQPSPQSLRR